MGTGASCHNSQESVLVLDQKVRSTFHQDGTIDLPPIEASRRKERQIASTSLDHTRSLVKNSPSPSGQPELKEELNCSWCDVRNVTTKKSSEKMRSTERVTKTESGCKLEKSYRSSKQCLFPYQDPSRPAIISELPKSPLYYEAVSNWKTSQTDEEKNEEKDQECKHEEKWIVGNNDDELGNEMEVKNSSGLVQTDSSRESVRTSVLVQDSQNDEALAGTDLILPRISVQLDTEGEEESQSSSDRHTNYDESENEGSNSSSTASSSSRTAVEGSEADESIKCNHESTANKSHDSIPHEMQVGHGCHYDTSRNSNDGAMTTTPKNIPNELVSVTEQTSPGMEEQEQDRKGEENEEENEVFLEELEVHLKQEDEENHIEEGYQKEGDGIISILDSLQECNLDEDVTMEESVGPCSNPDHCLCSHVCSDERYRDALLDMIREETPDRTDLVTSIFCDEFYHEVPKSSMRRSLDEDDVSLEVNIRSPSLAGYNVCRLCHTEQIDEDDNEDESTPQQYRVIEELELNKYELLDYVEEGEDEEEEEENEKLDDEEENLSSDLSTTVIIEEDSDLALGASTDQEIDFLGKNVSFDRDELSTILLRDKRKKFADLRAHISGDQHGSKRSRNDEKRKKIRNKKSRSTKNSKENCAKKRKVRRRSVCGKLECTFCDLVNLTGREGDNDEANHDWDQLDSDTIKLMDILEKLSKVLAEKAKGLVNRRNLKLQQRHDGEEEDGNQTRTVQVRQKDQLQGLRELGVSVKKVENHRRLLILKDDASQYRIQGL